MSNTKPTTNQTQATDKKMPDFRIVQEKAYFKRGQNGQAIKDVKLVELTVAWKETSSNDKPYLSFADCVMSITPDVDGRVKLVGFAIEPKNNAPS